MRTLLAFFLVAFAGVSLVFAQDPAPTDAEPANPAAAEEGAAPDCSEEAGNRKITVEGLKEETINFIKVLQGGGILMYPLAALSFIAVVLTIYYFLTVRQGTVVSDKFMNAADALIRKQDYLGLIAVCNRENEAIARITYKTLDFATKNPTASFEEVREVTEAEGSRQAGILHGRITYLADVGAIAPMVGMLGTVLGMIETFQDLSAHQGKVQFEVSQGVSKALITTASGLVIGITSLIFYSIFRGKVSKLISELEAAMTHLMALLAAQYKRANYRANTRTEDSRRNPKGV